MTAEEASTAEHQARLEREVAALREENQLLHDAAFLERDRLRAHVAALVQYASLFLGHMEGVERFDWHHLKTEEGRCTARNLLQKCLDAPDLAALVAREQAREAVVEAARGIVDVESAVSDNPFDALRAALRTLDALDG